MDGGWRVDNYRVISLRKAMVINNRQVN